MMNISKNLNKILEKNRASEGEPFTHVSQIKPKGRFNFTKSNRNTFMDTYCSIMFKILEDSDDSDEKEEKEEKDEKIDLDLHYGLAEKPNAQAVPIVIDVDLKQVYQNRNNVYDENISKIYSDKHVHSIIQIYQNVIRNVLKECNEDNLIAFFLEKPPYIKEYNDGKMYVKNGFHIHFPHTFIPKAIHLTHIIPRIRQLVNTMQVFKDLGVETSSDCMDFEAIINNPWLMYGSKKEESAKPYLLTKIFNSSIEEISLEEATKNMKIQHLNTEEEIDIHENEHFYLPYILSTNLFGRPISEVKEDLPNPSNVISRKAKTKSKTKRRYREASSNEAIIQSRELLGMISADRANDYNSWMNIGWTLYNIGDGNEDALDLWIDFSARCNEKFNEETCISEWEKMTKKELTIATLHYFAKRDNPSEYKKYIDEKNNDYIQKNPDFIATHNDIAKLLKNIYGSEYKCSDISNREWWRYQNHCWVEIKEGTDLRKSISSDEPNSILEIFIKKAAEYNEKFCRSESAESKMWEEKCKQVKKVISNLKNSTFKNCVMRECAEEFYDPCFKKKLNRNPYLMCFKNGVYDLKKNDFRDGVPEDYLSLQAPIFYVKDMQEDDIRVTQSKDLMVKLFPDTSLRYYAMDILSDMFVGGNLSKKVFCWTGVGHNGKSVLLEVIEKMLGPYAIKFPTSVITGARGKSSGASPELARCGNGVRWAIIQETMGKEEMNIGMLKELSGNDTFYARGLYKEGLEIEPMFKLSIVCNEAPRIPNGDQATWNRIRVLPFESIFKYDAPKSYEEQLLRKEFPRDDSFRDKIPGIVEGFAWLLLEHRKSGIRSSEPEKVRMSTAELQKKNDIYRQYIEECVLENRESSVSIIEIYSSFKNWYKESIPGSFNNTPTKQEVKDYLVRLWGEPVKGGRWNGFKLSNDKGGDNRGFRGMEEESKEGNENNE